MCKNEQFLAFFALGKFIAQTMLEGIYHPDLQDRNIGIVDGKFKFSDYADLEIISIPDDLTADVLDLLTESLFPLLDSMPDDFTIRSYFRAGFTSYGGELAHAVFLNAVNNGLSSFWYTTEKPVKAVYNTEDIYSDEFIAAAITEWKNYPLDRVTFKNYPCLEAYHKSNERRCISFHNKYFLDNLYYIRCYFDLKDPMLELPILIHNMADSAYRSFYILTAYGLYQKCLSMNSDNASVNAACQEGLQVLSNEFPLNSRIVEFIKKCTCYDLFEFLWILDDLDNFNFT